MEQMEATATGYCTLLEAILPFLQLARSGLGLDENPRIQKQVGTWRASNRVALAG